MKLTRGIIMKTLFHSLAMVTIVTAMTGCAPTAEEEAGSTSSATAQPGSTTQTTSASQVNSTSDLVADPDFDFRNDRDLRINFSDFPSEVGKFVVYHAYEHYEPETKTYYPDHTSRIASYVANTDITYTIQSLKEWQYLIFEWLPMDGNSHEQYMLVALSDQNDYTLSF
jgi:hypothetical protein